METPFSQEITYVRSNDLLADSRIIIETARSFAYKAINVALVQRNWLLGRRIAEEHLEENGRAEYGKQVIANLARQLTAIYGSSLDATNLYKFLAFYKAFPILDSLRLKSGKLLDWTHYRTLLQVTDPVAREWYMNEAGEQVWGVRTLQRNISSQYYQRMLMSQHKDMVKREMLEITQPLQDRLEFIKNPVVAEFLGMSQNTDFTETKLETAILNNIQRFLMELGKGYAFVARQQHIHTEKEDYFIDLVFYNFILKCFVLVDLKTSKITHQDVGQMDMYIRMYDALKRTEGDNPTLGIILCADTDSDIAKFSILHGNEQLFASKYVLYLPSEAELRTEIETQKEIFLEQHQKKV
jgi:predicted nuclease of restriction endonuclease-like (RecB) superfamily